MLEEEKNALLNEKIKWEEEKKILKDEIENAYQRGVSDSRKGLEKIFTDTQIDSILSGKSVSNYTDDDIAEALVLHSYSSKAYEYLRTKKNFPLPCVSTLNRRVAKLDIKLGVLVPVLQLLRQKTEKMQDFERLCVLSFDETSVACDWTYDKGTDTIHEPKQRLQCAMLRGLTSPWKQLVYYNFDTHMTKDILEEIIIKVEEAGLIVVAMVSDMGSSNLKLLRTLGVNIERTSFKNPASDDREIFVFTDAPHLIKLIRNNLLDSGFTLDGKGERNVTSSSINEIIMRSVRDLKTTFKLSEKHIEVEGARRMNVRLAAQLLSETTATTLNFFGEQGLLKSKDWETTSSFILLADKWFDLFNSRVPLDREKSSRHGYGKNLEKQNETLTQMIQTIQKMRVRGKNFLYQFQKGIIMSSKSLNKLYEMLNEKYNVTYLLTYRLNQDCLEHFFCCLRQMGGNNDNPSPVQIKYRVKKYLLGKEIALMGCGYNTHQDSDTTTVSDLLLSVSEIDTNTTNTVTRVNLNEELCLSAMIFALDKEELNAYDPPSFDVQGMNFEDAMEAEGLRYVGGFLVKKFPQYEFLGSNSTKNDNTWISACSRVEGKLKTPNKDFLEKLIIMEKLFNCYHGNSLLKAEENAFKNLTTYMVQLVSLPEDVIAYFIKCRVFFRMRILNRKLSEKARVMKKKAKLTSGKKPPQKRKCTDQNNYDM